MGPEHLAEDRSGRGIRPLHTLHRGTRAVIVDLSRLSTHERNKLMALGLVPGADVHVIQRFPSYVVAVGYTQLALDRETARLVLVQPI